MVYFATTVWLLLRTNDLACHNAMSVKYWLVLEGERGDRESSRYSTFSPQRRVPGVERFTKS